MIVEDSLGIAADLDARMQTSVDAYRDPWQEGAEPGHPRPVPHLAAAGGPAAGAGPMTAVMPIRRATSCTGWARSTRSRSGEGRAFGVDGQQVAVFRLRSGAVHAVSAVCPHQGGPLADGQIDGSVVLCPLHLNAFELATGCSPHRPGPLASWPVEVDDRRDPPPSADSPLLDPLPTDPSPSREQDQRLMSTPEITPVQAELARTPTDAIPRTRAASTGSTTGGRRTRTSGRRPAPGSPRRT